LWIKNLKAGMAFMFYKYVANPGWVSRRLQCLLAPPRLSDGSFSSSGLFLAGLFLLWLKADFFFALFCGFEYIHNEFLLLFPDEWRPQFERTHLPLFYNAPMGIIY